LADGRQAVTGSGDYTIKLWDLDRFKEVRCFEGHSGTVYTLALSADGKRLGSVSLDGTARIWNMDTSAEIAEFDPGTGPMYSVAFAAAGTLLTGGIDRTIRDWPAAGGDGTVLFPGAPE
jgi:WD40 repeat protein